MFVCMYVCMYDEYGMNMSRSKREFLYEIFGEAIKEGATTVIVADTVSITMPREYGELIADIKANTPGIENAIIACHCHNDLGLATANTVEVYIWLFYIREG